MLAFCLYKWPYLNLALDLLHLYQICVQMVLMVRAGLCIYSLAAFPSAIQSSGLLQRNSFGENSYSTVRGCYLWFFILWHQTLYVSFYSMKWWQKVFVKWTIQFAFTFSEQSLQLKTVTCFKDSHIKCHSGRSLCGREASPYICLCVWYEKEGNLAVLEHLQLY